MRTAIWYGVVLLFAPIMGNAASFDCKKATTDVEKMICTEARLSQLDDEMAVLYKVTLKSAASLGERDGILSDQRAWLKQRDKCQISSCISLEYSRRNDVLKNWHAVRADARVPKHYPPYPDVWEYQNADPEWRVIKARRTETGDVMIKFSPVKYDQKDRQMSFFAPGKWSTLSFEESSQIWGGIFPYDSARFSDGSKLIAGDSRNSRCYRKLEASITKSDSNRNYLGNWYVLYILPKPLPYATKPECDDGPDFVARVGVLSGSLTALEDDTFLLADSPSGLVIRFDTNFQSKSKLVGSKVFVFTQQEYYDLFGDLDARYWQEAHDKLHRVLTRKSRENRL
jgi:uncharacterized protein